MNAVLEKSQKTKIFCSLYENSRILPPILCSRILPPLLHMREGLRHKMHLLILGTIKAMPWGDLVEKNVLFYPHYN